MLDVTDSEGIGVIVFSPLGQGMLTKGAEVTGAIIRGIDTDRERSVSQVLDHIVEGNPDALRPGSFGIILGLMMESSL